MDSPLRWSWLIPTLVLLIGHDVHCGLTTHSRRHGSFEASPSLGCAFPPVSPLNRDERAGRRICRRGRAHSNMHHTLRGNSRCLVVRVLSYIIRCCSYTYRPPHCPARSAGGVEDLACRREPPVQWKVGHTGDGSCCRILVLKCFAAFYPVGRFREFRDLATRAYL